MKNHIAILLFVGLAVLVTAVQASDFDSDFGFYHNEPRIEKFQKKQNQRKALLQSFRQYPDDYKRFEEGFRKETYISAKINILNRYIEKLKPTTNLCARKNNSYEREDLEQELAELREERKRLIDDLNRKINPNKHPQWFGVIPRAALNDTRGFNFTSYRVSDKEFMFQQNLEKKIAENSWSSLPTQLKTRFYNWYSRK